MCYTSKSSVPAQWEQLDDNLWTVWRPLSFFGLPLGTRMTIVRLSSGDLWVHSPFDPGPELREKMDSLGPVRHLLCPNKMHHMLVGDLMAHYPEAQLYLSKGLPSKRPDLAPHAKIVDHLSDTPWQDDLKVHSLKGHLFLDELVILHTASRTLILTDLLWGCSDDYPWYLRFLTRLGAKGQSHAPPPEMRVLFYPRKLARESMEAILSWDFERVVLAHGPLITKNGKERFRGAFAFLLR